MKLKFRLFLLGILAVTATLILTGMQYFGMQSLSVFSQAANQSTQVKTQLLALHVHEKDFLNDLNLSFVDQFESSYQTLNQQLDSLVQIIGKLDIDSQETEIISQLLVSYHERFSRLVNLQKEIGLSAESGLRGQLKQAAEGVEAELDILGEEILLRDILILRQTERDFFLHKDPALLDEFEQNFNKMQVDLETSSLLAISRDLVKNLLDEYRSNFQTVVSSYQTKGINQAQGLLGELNQTVQEIQTQSNRLSSFIQKRVQERTQSQNITAMVASAIIIILMVISIMLLAASIIKPITALAKTMDESAENKDLTLRAPQMRDDELGMIANAFNGMLSSYQSFLHQVTGSITQVSAAAEQLSVVTGQTSQGVQKQQDESDQAATATNEMSATAAEVAKHALEAAKASELANDKAEHGRSIVNHSSKAIENLALQVDDACATIQKLEQESNNIGDVLNVIRDIAEQTNLLALNAAIEAARAGEQGRGFAVVADEVRSLASRSEESVEEIRGIIERLQSGARNAAEAMNSGRSASQEGVHEVKATGDALLTITQAITTINDMNAQIASAAEQQSAVAEEINRNVSHIQQINVETAKGAEQTTSTSQSLAQLAAELQSMIQVFKLDDTSTNQV